MAFQATWRIGLLGHTRQSSRLGVASPLVVYERSELVADSLLHQESTLREYWPNPARVVLSPRVVFADVTMDAPSLGDQRAFYGDVLGLPLDVDASDEVAFQAGRTRITFRQAPPGTTPTYHFALRVPGNQFREAKSWLAERAELLRDGGQDEFDWDFWGALAVYAEDPAGNVIELIAFPNLPPAADAEFGAASILGIAELGLPVSDVRAAVAELRNEFGIGLWDRDEITPAGLTPVGEQGATFIVVPVGRTWFLGGVASADPMDVTLGGVGAGQLELAGHPYLIRGGS